MFRAQFKDADYFDEYIDFEAYAIDDLTAELKLANDAAKTNRLKSAVFSSSFRLMIAMYSRGDEKAAVKKYYEDQFLDKFCTGWEHHISDPGVNNRFSLDSYTQMLHSISLAVLLEIDSSKFERLVALLDKTGKSDRLLDFIINYRIDDRKIGNEVFYSPNFGPLVQAAETEGLAAIDIIKHHLDNTWYKSFKGSYWHESHKSGNDVYFGYWSFESAAIVKIKKLDDSLLRKSIYYPPGLV